MEENKRTVGYICPACHQSVVMERTAFQLTASDRVHLPCPCGKSAVDLELDDQRVTLTVPCLLCDESHRVSCALDAFLDKPMLAFSCGSSGVDCCYVGEHDRVVQSMMRLEEATDKVKEERAERGAFLDEIIMHEVLSELRDIAQRGGVSCTCGSGSWTVDIHYSSVDLKCATCGGTLRIPAAVADDLDHICSKDKLVIQGVKS